MFTMIRGAEVYSPKKMGPQDILLCNDKIIALGEGLKFHYRGMKEIHAEGMLAVPGFLDQHVHITGGGGERSFCSRIREISPGQLVRGGITTVVGLLGTDGTTRSIENLVAKTKALNEDGLTAFCLTGSYEYPSPTLTGSVTKDIMFIQEMLGLKLAISDHRGSQMTEREIIRAASEVHRAAILSGKPGYICFHTGLGKEGLQQLMHIAESSDIPIDMLRPTHMSRCLSEAIAFSKMGGWIDFTAGSNASRMAAVISRAFAEGEPSRITLSSDGNGSYSVKDKQGQLVRLGIGQVSRLWKSVRAVVEQDVLPLEQALTLITENPARALGLYPHKGCIQKNADADIVLLKNMEIDTVFAKGKMMMQEGNLLYTGYYQYSDED